MVIEVVGFFLVLAFTTCCFFYLEFREVDGRFGIPGQFERLTLSTEHGHSRVEFLGEKGGDCDLFEGNWVWDESYPLYASKDCNFPENGRPDLFYTKWRWQPNDCNLPRY
ncbi:putative PMR5 domain, trichome birefringence-like family [Medicago truncatula]|uniref:Putative PMR5 domain, trichome birefringence-like family n=1 Tax=Medicago truncatula TaxID=3880 RepID=A0A396J7Y9_MEDTR|nr:putative PMR5 domain, trichome birefringence-like family [Medicago truncatula]